jgi:light-regulated signal transduction histidine kinase (bacteriophytochrome)
MVLSYSQWMSRSASSKLTEEEVEMLTCVRENAARLGNLLTDLREYIFLSESEGGTRTLVDCNAVVTAVRNNLHGAISETGAVIEASPLPSVPGVEVLLLQILQNLVANSIKYRSEAAPLIRISAESAPGGWTFSVADNGIGIDPKQAEYVFGVFKRLHGRKYAGTGIGLAICKAAVERLGGRIWVALNTGPGATVQFFLPEESNVA